MMIKQIYIFVLSAACVFTGGLPSAFAAQNSNFQVFETHPTWTASQLQSTHFQILGQPPAPDEEAAQETSSSSTPSIEGGGRRPPPIETEPIPPELHPAPSPASLPIPNETPSARITPRNFGGNLLKNTEGILNLLRGAPSYRETPHFFNAVDASPPASSPFLASLFASPVAATAQMSWLLLLNIVLFCTLFRLYVIYRNNSVFLLPAYKPLLGKTQAEDHPSSSSDS